MGGILEDGLPKLTEAEIFNRLIEIGRTASVPNPHSLWVVLDPRPLCYEIDRICFAVSIAHLEKFTYSIEELQKSHIVFFTYQDSDLAKLEAYRRLAEFAFILIKKI